MFYQMPWVKPNSVIKMYKILCVHSVDYTDHQSSDFQPGGLQQIFESRQYINSWWLFSAITKMITIVEIGFSTMTNNEI